MKCKINKTKYEIQELMVYQDDLIEEKRTCFSTLKEAEKFYDMLEDNMLNEINSTGSFRGYDQNDFCIGEANNTLNCMKLVIICDKAQEEPIYTLGLKKEN
ncbi:MAG: hypothetical protein IKV81_01985 [Clostridia bacterium]|nr:hypothetical protein [Clostridia bacterium]